MQRTTVLYAVAAATLAGAFFLVVTPKAPPPAPVPEPAAPPPATAPLTHLSYADGTLQVDARLDRGQMLAGSYGEPLWLDLEIAAKDAGGRAQLATVLVIDRSGSMAGEKIDNARMAAERLLRRLQDGDQIAIVSYGTDVTVDLPLSNVTRESRARADAIVQRIEEGGGTNIDGAMAAATRIVGNAQLQGLVGRVILISDGRATEGERRTDMLARHSDQLRQRGVTVSTLGVGLDYHEDLMEALAVRGGGRYHYLRKSSQLSRILDDELAHASRVVARGAQIVLPESFAGLRVAEAPGLVLDRAGGQVILRLGDLAAAEVRHVLIRLDRTSAFGGQTLDAALRFGAPELVYRPHNRDDSQLLAHRADSFRVLLTRSPEAVELSRRDDVRLRVLQVQASLGLTDSMQAYASGNVNAALTTLESNRQALDAVAEKTQDAKLKAEAENLKNVLQQMKRAAPSSLESQDLIKQQKARAYELRR